jgi:hypothetical protein
VKVWISRIIGAWLIVILSIPNSAFGGLTPDLFDLYDQNTDKGSYSVVAGTSTLVPTYSFAPNREVCERRQTLGGPCSRTTIIKGGTSTFTHCSIEDIENCVSSVSAKLLGSKSWTEGSISLPTIPFSLGLESSNFDAIPSMRMPSGRTAFLVTFNGLMHEGGSEYLISVSTSTDSYISGDFRFTASIQAVKYKSEILRTKPYFSGWELFDFYDLPMNMEFEIKIRLGLASQHISTWFTGRIRNPEIENPPGTLVIRGEPQAHPLAATRAIPYSDFEVPIEWLSISSSQRQSLEQKTEAYGFWLQGEYPFEFDVFEKFGERLKTNVRVNSWLLESTSNDRNSFSSCSDGRVLGFVTSSAAIFQKTPPRFSEKDGVLEYRLASPHLAINQKDLALENISFVVNRSFAECLWKTTINSLNQVSLSASYLDGSNVLLTTSLVKTLDNFIIVSSNNISFSSPLIKLEFARSITSAIPTASPTPTPPVRASAKSKENTITCVKGLIKRKFREPVLKCPKGFRKLS